MTSTDEIVRDLIGKTNIDLKTIYGVEQPLSDFGLSEITNAAEELKKDPVYICDVPGTPEDV